MEATESRFLSHNCAQRAKKKLNHINYINHNTSWIPLTLVKGSSEVFCLLSLLPGEQGSTVLAFFTWSRNVIPMWLGAHARCDLAKNLTSRLRDWPRVQTTSKYLSTFPRNHSQAHRRLYLFRIALHPILIISTFKSIEFERWILYYMPLFYLYSGI